MGGAGDRRRGQTDDAALLHGDAGPWRGTGGIHPDAAVYAETQGQPDSLDGGTLRCGTLWTARGVSVSEAEGGVRPAADRRPHQSGPGDFTADHTVESARLRGHSRDAAGDPDRGVAHLRAAVV